MSKKPVIITKEVKRTIDQNPIDDKCPEGFYLIAYIPGELKVCVEKFDPSQFTEEELKEETLTFSYLEV